ncbi:pseudouridine synthase [Kaistia dalseonensis]|uniref:Pseudouridine synthase n=1 Tax=Kaistia dalseonensis TaxID=410840 RepID=A0ABU0HET8_9HYPH|nr:pseudouridine synthase [Kaistia dalseonensis]MCX5497356.1 pseudouridine synthase [Kaistia dalseonensis]MDQ0439994.1 23S rRNA pseudouridine2605 synthase [Kaistia dalseonensis]
MKPPKKRMKDGAAQAGATVDDQADRIAKVLARAGLCSRRDAERWITEGRVALNGKVLTSPAVNVGPNDVVEVDGKPLPQKERTRLWLYHKPRGLVTTARDPEGRPTVFDSLPDHLPRVIAVGRLDINTEGLLLLTNDGGLARVLELPSTGWLRRYRVRAWGSEVLQPDLDKLKDGVTIDGVMYGAIEATLDRIQGTNLWISLGLREGKNREVKKVLASLGLEVSRLIRVSYGPFQLGDLPEGQAVEIRGRVLRDQLGPKLANDSGADFDAPLRELEDEPRRPAPRRDQRPAAPVEEAPAAARPHGRRAGRAQSGSEGEREFRPKRPSSGRGRESERFGEPSEGARGAGPRSQGRAQRPDDGIERSGGFKPGGRRPRAGAAGESRLEDRPRDGRAFEGPMSRTRPDQARSDEREPRGGRARRAEFGGKPRSEGEPRSEGRSRADSKPGADHFGGERPGGRGGKPSGGRGGRPSGGKPAGDRPSGGRSPDGKPFGGKPSGGGRSGQGRADRRR